MTDEQARQDTSAETATESVSPGRMLREGRERLNLTPGQVAERLRLRQQIVTDLEQDQFDKYMAGTFTRGYLRAYARLVNVDEGQVLAAYESLGINDKPQDMQSFSRRTRQQSQDNRLMLVTYIIGAIIIGSAVIFWLQNNDQTDEDTATPAQQQGVAERMVAEQDSQADIAQTDTTPTDNTEVSAATRDPIFIDTSLLDNERMEPVASQQTSQDAGATETEPAQVASESLTAEQGQQADTPQREGSEQENSEQENSEQQSSEQETTEQEAADQGSEVEQDAVDQAAEIPQAELVLVFAGDTWIRVEDASGEAIAFGVKPEGHTSALDGEPPYDITLGAPENVTLYFQGNPIDLSSYRAGRVARLSLPANE